MSRDKGGVVNVDHRWGLLGGLRWAQGQAPEGVVGSRDGWGVWRDGGSPTQLRHLRRRHPCTTQHKSSRWLLHASLRHASTAITVSCMCVCTHVRRQLSEGERAEWGEAVRLMAASGDTAAVVGGEGEAAPVGMMAMLVQAVVTAEAVGVELDIAQLAAWVRANHVQAVLAVQVGDEAEHDDELGLEQAEEGEQEQDGQEQGHDHDWQLEEVEEVDAAL